MFRFLLSLIVYILILGSYVASSPVSKDQCQFQGAQLYTKAIVSQEIEDADRIPLTMNATRFE